MGKGFCAHKSRSLFWLLFIVSLVTVNPVITQDFGRFRTGIRWNQINDTAFRIIFPEGMEKQAVRVASNIRYINTNHILTVGPRTKKINLILNNQGVVSNGYVALLPFRSEFYTIPMQDAFVLGSMPWIDLLSLHEYRHALQYENARIGITKMSYWLSGETGWASLINLSIPKWFFEGDAVATETSLSNYGRGRMPSFLQQYKSILTTRRPYSYMKARNGSFRDIVPDEYELGYLLCSYGRENFSNNMWAKVLYGSSLLTGAIFYPFSLSLFTETKMTTNLFYLKAFGEYRKKWTAELAKTVLTPKHPFFKEPSTPTSYRYPVYMQDGSILVFKRSFDRSGAIYRITPDNKEVWIVNTGISQDPYFSAGGNRIAWTQVTWDPRFSSLSYSNVVVYQTDKRESTYLTHKSRYFSPALSRDGSQIAVVEVDLQSNSHLVILDSGTGSVIRSLPNEEGMFLSYPKWDTDEKSLICTARTPRGNMLMISQDINTAAIKHLSDESSTVISDLLVTKDSILFTTGLNGTNNIHSFNRADRSVHRLTGSRYGAYFPAVDPVKKRLIYSDFDRKGYQLVSAPLDSLAGIPAGFTEGTATGPLDFNYFKDEGGDILSKVPANDFKVSRYSQLGHIVKFHTWYISPNFASISINGVSDNILNNLHVEGSLSYYYNEKTPGINATVSYGGIYPILSASVASNYRYIFTKGYLGLSTNPVLQSLDNSMSFKANLPLDLSRGEYFRQASISADYSYIYSENRAVGTENFGSKSQLHSLGAGATYSATRMKAYKNITTPLGFKLDLSATKAFASLRAAQYQALADFAVRGFSVNDNLVLTAGYKSENSGNDYRYLDLFVYPRGYYIPTYDRILSLQASYHFPLFYPDWGFAGIFYCSRVRTALFTDYARTWLTGAYGEKSGQTFMSTGAELIFDSRLFNITDIPLGIRFSLLLSPDMSDPNRKTKIEFVIPVIRL